ncbi:MAG: hypothetical protein MUP71_14280 [Candidatus Aminicenantes bacterium]|nr:hypothetical protein [Candidatus Aminicenantes bacterium]
MIPFKGCLDLPMIHLKLNPGMQWVITFLAVVIKPTYMILSLLLIIWLWRAPEPSLRLLRWALIFFLSGEMFCALNYLLTNSQSDLLEILHSLGMVGMSMLLPWGFLLLLDDRIIHFSNKNSKCELIKLCDSCWKFTDAACKFKQLSWFAIPAVAAVALLPLPAPINSSHVVTWVLGNESHFVLSPLLQWLEFRIFPLLACFFMLVSLFFLTGNMTGLKKAQGLFFMGFGFMLYSLLKFLLNSGFAGLPQWANFWEEITELMMVVGLAIFLGLFHRQLHLTLPWSKTDQEM